MAMTTENSIEGLDREQIIEKVTKEVRDLINQIADNGGEWTGRLCLVDKEILYEITMDDRTLPAGLVTDVYEVSGSYWSALGDDGWDERQHGVYDFAKEVEQEMAETINAGIESAVDEHLAKSC